MFYECLDRMLAQGEWRWLISFYENQPWEKLAALCAKAHGVRTVSVQTAILSRYYLSYFLGAGEAARMPLPDIICTSGPAMQALLIEGGTPPDRLRLCGSIRYNTPWAQGAASEPLPPAPRAEILVALPIDTTLAAHLLRAIRESFPHGGQAEGVRFSIKPHPMCPIDGRRVGFSASVIDSSFTNLAEAFQRCGLVLFVGSTVGFEALAAGRAALRYRAKLLLDVDEVYGESVPICNDETLRDAVLRLVHDGPALPSSAAIHSLIAQPFAPFDGERMRAVFRVGQDIAEEAGASAARRP
jgi:hypothetical protein